MKSHGTNTITKKEKSKIPGHATSRSKVSLNRSRSGLNESNMSINKGEMTPISHTSMKKFGFTQSLLNQQSIKSTNLKKVMVDNLDPEELNTTADRLSMIGTQKGYKSSFLDTRNVRNKGSDPIKFVNPIKQVQCTFKCFTVSKREMTDIAHHHISKLERN